MVPLGTIRAVAPFCGRSSVHVPKRLTLGLGPPSGVSIGRLSGVGALWDCVPHVCGGGAAVPAAVCRWGLARAVLMWGGVSRG